MSLGRSAQRAQGFGAPALGVAPRGVCRPIRGASAGTACQTGRVEPATTPTGRADCGSPRRPAALRQSVTALRAAATAGFLRLPPDLQRRTLHLVRRYAPWEAGFAHDRPPEPDPGWLVAPPDFVGIGVQKAGTTWWHALVEAHPGVHRVPGAHKERHFFGRFAVQDFGAADVVAYHRWFARPPGALAGEWTPDYCHQPWVGALLAEAAPEARLLVLLRDPVARLRSGLAHHRARGDLPAAVAAADAFARGFYARELAPYREHFGPRMLVLQYEACVDDPARWLATTYRFLGLDDAFSPEGLRRPVNPTPSPLRLPAGFEAAAADAYRADAVELASWFSELDLDRWPSVARASGGARSASS